MEKSFGFCFVSSNNDVVRNNHPFAVCTLERKAAGSTIETAQSVRGHYRCKRRFGPERDSRTSGGRRGNVED